MNAQKPETAAQRALRPTWGETPCYCGADAEYEYALTPPGRDIDPGAALPLCAACRAFIASPAPVAPR